MPLLSFYFILISLTDVAKTTKFKLDPRLMDHGQSNPEDVDMYSTRS